MQLAFKINAFANKPNLLEYGMRTIHEAGFKSVGLVFDKPFLWIRDFRRSRIREIEKLLYKYDLTVADVSSCTASGFERLDNDFTPAGQRFGPSFTSRDAQERRRRIDHTENVIDFAVALGCKNVDTSTGKQPDDMSFKTAWDLTRKCLVRICDYAEKRGVSLNIEYEPGEFGPGGLFVGDAHTLLAMVADVGSPALGANLDVGHSYVCAEDIPATVRLLDDRVRVVELDDIKSERDAKGILRRRHYHLVPGEGEIKYHYIFEALREIAFTGPVIVELYSLYDKNPEDACRKTYEYLTRNFGKYF